MKKSLILFLLPFVLVTCNEKPVILVSNAYRVFPNPTWGRITVQFENLPNGISVKLKALDVKGNKVLEDDFIFSGNISQKIIDFPSEQEGNCYLEIEIDGVKFRDKIVKLKN